jgi:hypothetical protein
MAIYCDKIIFGKIFVADIMQPKQVVINVNVEQISD